MICAVFLFLGALFLGVLFLVSLARGNFIVAASDAVKDAGLNTSVDEDVVVVVKEFAQRENTRVKEVASGFESQYIVCDSHFPALCCLY